MRAKPPRQKARGESEQAVGTPERFLEAVKRLLNIGTFAVDLAADVANTVAETWFDEGTNAFTQDWHRWCGSKKGWAWLNPPFADIAPWAQKCWEESRRGAMIALLVPNARDAAWFREWARGKGYVIDIEGRFAFVGHTQSYPKGLALILYAPFLHGGERAWDWREFEKAEKAAKREAKLREKVERVAARKAKAK